MGGGGGDESLSRVDSSVPLMRHDPNDLRSQIRFWILPKKRTLIFKSIKIGFIPSSVMESDRVI